MVVLRDEFGKKYPNLENYLRKDFVNVRTNSRVMRAFMKWSAPGILGIHPGFIGYGSLPEIAVSEGAWTAAMCKYEHGESKSSSRETKLKGFDLALTTEKGLIVLNENLVDLLVVAIFQAQHGAKFPDDEQTLTVTEATIMHEMVHWSYFVRGIDEKKKYGGDFEYGTRHFEQEAYGSVIGMGTEFIKKICKVRKTATFMGIRKDPRCLILEVQPGSPAAKAGLQKGDYITKIDNEELARGAEGVRYEEILIYEKKPGDQVTLLIHRGAMNYIEEFPVKLTLGSTTDDSWW